MLSNLVILLSATLSLVKLEYLRILFKSSSFKLLLETSKSDSLGQSGKCSSETRSHSAATKVYRLVSSSRIFLISGVNLPICTPVISKLVSLSLCSAVFLMMFLISLAGVFLSGFFLSSPMIGDVC